MSSAHVDRLRARVARVLAGPRDSDADLVAVQRLLDATALELDSPERALAEAMRSASNEIEMVRFTVAREAWPSELESRLAPLRALMSEASDA